MNLLLLYRIKCLPKNTNGRLAIPAVAGLLVLFATNQIVFAFLSLTYLLAWPPTSGTIPETGCVECGSLDLQRWRSRHSVRRSELLTRSHIVIKAKSNAYRRRWGRTISKLHYARTVLGKIIKIVATRCKILKLKCIIIIIIKHICKAP